MMRTRWMVLLMSAVAACAQTVDRTKPPQTPPIPSYKLPPVSDAKLPNGMAVQLVQDSRFPLVTARLVFQAGTKFDPVDLPGLSEAVAGLLTEGTKGRTSLQLSEEIDGLGGSLSAGSNADSMEITGAALSENLNKMLELMADVARNASFPKDEVDLYKQNRVQNLMQERSQPSYLAEEEYSKVIFGSSPYAHIGPTEASIAKIDGKTLAMFRDTYLAPNNATLILIGNLPAQADVIKSITQYFGSWQQKTVPASPKIDLPAPKRTIVLVDRPGSVQADIYVGRSAPTRTGGADFFPLVVANTVLGGGMDSRMFRDIREKEGFAYDAHSEYSTDRDAASIRAVTEVRNEVLEPALKSVLSELEQMGAQPVSAQELSSAKNFKAGVFLLSLETQDGVSSQLATINTLGLSRDYLDTYVTKVRSVEPQQLQAAAKKYIAPGQSAIIVVGDASKIAEALKKFGDVTAKKPE